MTPPFVIAPRIAQYCLAFNDRWLLRNQVVNVARCSGSLLGGHKGVILCKQRNLIELLMGKQCLELSCNGVIAFYVHPPFVNNLDSFKITVDFTPFPSLKYLLLASVSKSSTSTSPL